MKNILQSTMLFFVFLVSSKLMAQKKIKVNEIQGEPYKIQNFGKLGRIEFVNAMEYEGSFYAIMIDARYGSLMQYFIYKLNDKMEVVDVFPIEVRNYDHSVRYFNNFIVDGRLMMFFVYSNKKQKKNFLFCQSTNLRGKDIKVFKLGEAEYSKRINPFKMFVSTDKKYFTIIKTSQEKLTHKQKSSKTIKSVNADFDYTVYNSNFELTSFGKKVNIKLDKKNEESIYRYFFMQNGKIGVMTRKNAEKPATESGKKKPIISALFRPSVYHYNFYFLEDGNAELIEIDHESKYFDMEVVLSNDSIVHFSGLLTADGKATKSIKLFKLNTRTKELSEYCNASMQVLEKTMLKVTSSEVEVSKKNKPKSSKKGEVSGKNKFKTINRLSYMKIKENGDAILVSEGFDVQTVTHTSGTGANRTSTTTTYYIFGPLAVIDIDTGGQIKGATFVDYKIIYANFNPGSAHTSNLQGEYFLISTRLGYAVGTFEKNEVIKLSQYQTIKMNRWNRFYQNFDTGKYPIYISRKKKKLTFYSVKLK